MKTVSFSFLHTLIPMETVFRQSEIVFLDKCFILDSENGFSVNFEPFVFTQSFLLLVDTILELGLKQFFLFFQVLKVEALFPASENGFSIECFIPASGKGFSVSRSFIQSKFGGSRNHYSN